MTGTKEENQQQTQHTCMYMYDAQAEIQTQVKLVESEPGEKTSI